MYYYFRQGVIPPRPVIEEGLTIRKRFPQGIVPGMSSMQIGRKKLLYYNLMTFFHSGFSRVFCEYDLMRGETVLSKAVLISKVPIYQFLPHKGVHICYCETIPEERGKGYYPLLLGFVQNANPDKDLYMVVDVKNSSSIKGVEKAGFVKFAEGEKMADGCFIITK